MPTILQRIAAGDRSAVAECLDQYGDALWRLANRYLYASPADAEDVIQEIFVELWLVAGRYDPAKGSEAAFIATVARRRLIDRRRKIASRPALHQDLESMPVSPSNPSDQPHHEEAGRLLSEFNRLPEDERVVLRLALVRGLSHREIGIATGTPIGTVKTRLRRGVMRLQEVMQGATAGATADGSAA